MQFKIIVGMDSCIRIQFVHTGAIPYTWRRSSNDESALPVYRQSINCSGSENTLWSCSRNESFGQTCTSNSDAYSVCFYGKYNIILNFISKPCV